MRTDLEIINTPSEHLIQNGRIQEIQDSFTVEERLEIAKTPWFKIILFNGFERQIKKIQQVQKEVEEDSGITLSPRRAIAIVIPPSGFITEEDLICLNKHLMSKTVSNIRANNGIRDFRSEREEYKNSVVEFLKKEKKISQKAASLLTEYITNSQIDVKWDDRILYRMYAIVGFVEQSIYSTLGEYAEANHKYIEDQVRQNDFSAFEQYEYFIKNMINNSNILMWRKRSSKKNQELIYSLNRQETKDLMNLKPFFVPAHKYTASLQENISMIRNTSTLTKNEIFKILSNAVSNIAQRKEYWDNDLFYEAHTAGQKVIISLNDYMDRGIHPTLIKIVKFTDKNQEKMTMLDFVVLLKWFLKTNYVIRSSDLNKSLSIFDLAIEKFDNPLSFTKLLTRTFLQHEGIIPSYTEWKKYIELTDQDEDFNLPISLIMPLIVSNMNSTSSMRSYMDIIESVRRNYDSIILNEDKD